MQRTDPLLQRRKEVANRLAPQAGAHVAGSRSAPSRVDRALPAR